MEQNKIDLDLPSSIEILEDGRTETRIKLSNSRTAIDPDGLEITGYKRNPVVLVNNDPRLIVGRSNIRLDGDTLIATMEPHDWLPNNPSIADMRTRLELQNWEACIGLVIGKVTFYRNQGAVINKASLTHWSFILTSP